jgi:hypothetical protein
VKLSQQSSFEPVIFRFEAERLIRRLNLKTRPMALGERLFILPTSLQKQQSNFASTSESNTQHCNFAPSAFAFASRPFACSRSSIQIIHLTSPPLPLPHTQPTGEVCPPLHPHTTAGPPSPVDTRDAAPAGQSLTAWVKTASAPAWLACPCIYFHKHIKASNAF